jgi:hypothetical protein
MIEDIIQVPLKLTGQFIEFSKWRFRVDNVIRGHGAPGLDAIFETFDAKTSKPLIKTLNYNMRNSPDKVRFHDKLLQKVDGAKKADTFKKWVEKVEHEYYKLTMKVAQTNHLLAVVKPHIKPNPYKPAPPNGKQQNQAPQHKPNNLKQNSKGSGNPPSKQADASKQKPQGPTGQCQMCGKPHGNKQCFFSVNKHPDCNNSSKAWAESYVGIKYKELNRDSLSNMQKLSADRKSLIPYQGPPLRVQDTKVSVTPTEQTLDQHNGNNKNLTSLFHVNREVPGTPDPNLSAKPTEKMSKQTIEVPRKPLTTTLRDQNPIEANLIDISRNRLKQDGATNIYSVFRFRIT